MLLLLLLLAVIFGIIGVGFRITGALLAGFAWAFIRLPLALMFGTLGVACCATILLIPIGLIFFKFAGFLVNPCI